MSIRLVSSIVLQPKPALFALWSNSCGLIIFLKNFKFFNFKLLFFYVFLNCFNILMLKIIFFIKILF
jgi:hypothetical protein